MIVLAWTDAAEIADAFLPKAPASAREPIGRALADVRSELTLPVSSLMEILSIIRRHARRFDKVFGRFGRDTFYVDTLPKAVRTYAEDPPFLDQALQNVLKNGESVRTRDVPSFFGTHVPRAIQQCRYSVYELKDKSVRDTPDFLSSEEAAEEADQQIGTLLAPEDVRRIAEKAINARLAEAEEERREQIESLLAVSKRELSPFERYGVDTMAEEQRVRIMLPTSFRAKLLVEADETEAALLLAALDEARERVRRFRARSRKLRSDVGLLFADNALLLVEGLIIKYLETPSKVYSVLARGHITQALQYAQEKLQSEERMMDADDPKRILSEEDVEGFVTSGVCSLKDETDKPFARVPDPVNLGARSSTLQARVDGPVIRIYDKAGHPHARYRDTLKHASRARSNVLIANGAMQGYIKAETDEHGGLVLGRNAAGAPITRIDVPPGILPIQSNLTFELAGTQALLPLGDRTVRLLLPKLREAVTTADARRGTVDNDDVVVFKKDRCNIALYATGSAVQVIGLPFIALRLAEVIDALERTYPGKRLEEILPETIEIKVTPQKDMRGSLASTNCRGNVFVHLESEHPVLIASSLLHEDAHSLCTKVIGDVIEYVAERFRDNRPYFGTKTVTKTVEQAVQEVFARLVQIRFLVDARRMAVASSDIVGKKVRMLIEHVRIDLEHFVRQQLLSEKGLRLAEDFEREIVELQRLWDGFEIDVPVETPNVPSFGHTVFPKGSDEAASFLLDALAEGTCTDALERYGLLPSPRHAMLKGWAPRALPSPAAAPLVGQPSFQKPPRKPKKKREERISHSDRFEAWLAEHPETQDSVDRYREVWGERLREPSDEPEEPGDPEDP